MTWEPEPRPEWMRNINDGAMLLVNAEAEKPFGVDELMAEAQAAMGLADDETNWGAPDFVEPLRLVLGQLESTAGLTVFGRWFARRFVLRLLQGRLQLHRYEAHDPGVVGESIAAPIFVVGAPRTGTTHLHTLLATDPSLRAPQGWEFLYPAPPPGDEPVDEARVAMADTELAMLHLVNSTLQSIHTYRGRMLKECLSAMSFSFRSEEFVSRYHVPEYVAWLQDCDMTPAYEMHRRVLQVLQRRTPGTRWVVKSPVHLHNLDVLLQVYPDARLVVTHRDPLTVLSSVTSLIATLRHAQTDHVDIEAIGQYHADLYCDSLDGLVSLSESEALPGDRTAHISYDEMVADPTGTVTDLYSSLGIEQSAEAKSALATHLSTSGRPAEPHRYSFDSLGIDRAATRQRLSRYADYFDVAMAP